MIKFYKNNPKHFRLLLSSILTICLLMADNFDEFVFCIGLFAVGLFIVGFVIRLYWALKD